MKTIPIFALFLIVPLLAFAAEKEPFQRITIDQVAVYIGQSDFFVFDANSKKTYRAGHVPGAKHIEFRSYPKSALPSDKSAKLVFYCANPMCTASHEAAKRAVGFGYKNVYVMTDGIEGWKTAKKTVEQ